jgi:hypothetical protein
MEREDRAREPESRVRGGEAPACKESFVDAWADFDAFGEEKHDRLFKFPTS